MSALLTKNRKLIFIALAVVLIVTAVVLLNPRTGTSDLPPTLSLPRSLLQGSTNISCLMPGYSFDAEDVATYTEPVVYPAPEESDLRVNDHIYFADKDMTVSDIFENIVPIAGNKVTLAYYSNGKPGLPPGFYMYPQVEGNFTVDDPNTFTIPRNHGFILFSCLQSKILNVRSEEKGGLALPEPAMREANNTWFLTSLADLDDLAPYSHRIDDIYYQNAPGIGVPFEKLGEDELRNSAFFAVWLKIETPATTPVGGDDDGAGTGAPIVPPAERRLPDGLTPDPVVEGIDIVYEYSIAEYFDTEPADPVEADDGLPAYIFTIIADITFPDPPTDAFEITDVTFPKNNRNKVAPFPTIELEVKTTDSFSTEAFDGYTFAVHYKIDDADQRKLRTRAEWEARTARTDVPYTITQAWPNNAPKIDDYDSYQNFSYDYRSYTVAGEAEPHKNLSTPLLKQALAPSVADESIHLTIDNFGLDKYDPKDVIFYIVGYRAADDQGFVLAEREFGNRKDPRPDVALQKLRGGAAYYEYDDDADALVTLAADPEVDFVHLAGRFPRDKDISDSDLTVSLGYWHEDENSGTKKLNSPDPILADQYEFDNDLTPIFTEDVEATEDECNESDCIGEGPSFKWRIGKFDEEMQLRAKNWEKAYFDRDFASEWKNDIAIPTTHKSLEFFVVNLRSDEQYTEDNDFRGKYYYVFVEITNEDGFSRVFFFPKFKIGDYDEQFNDSDYLVEAED